VVLLIASSLELHESGTY